MKRYTKQALLAVALLGSIATNSVANTQAYAYESQTKDAKLTYEFKKGDFNPYWFEEKVSDVKSYAYEASTENTPVYREFKKGDFNPYGFED
jgi:hypothetical protein